MRKYTILTVTVVLMISGVLYYKYTNRVKYNRAKEIASAINIYQQINNGIYPKTLKDVGSLLPLDIDLTLISYTPPLPGAKSTDILFVDNKDGVVVFCDFHTTRKKM
jgi:hypothetical protein